jgi:hypothetical protein
VADNTQDNPHMQTPLVDNKYLIEKQQHKGGWAYVALPGIPKEVRQKTGLTRVRGLVDDYPLSQFHLLPMKNGNMMLPIKTAIRKQIGKEVGDYVQVELYLDDSPVVIPDDFLVCLMESPEANEFFITLSETNQKYYIDWVEEAKKLETKADRICKVIERLERGDKFWDW